MLQFVRRIFPPVFYRQASAHQINLSYALSRFQIYALGC